MRRVHLFLPLAAILCLPTIAAAHAIGVTCTIVGAKVEVEAFYDDDTPAIKAKVRVVNAQNEVVASGVTDKAGVWLFAMPTPGEYEVRVDAGAGHRAKKSLRIAGTAPAAEPAKDAETPTVMVQEETREELTRTPWLRIAIGLVVIFAVSVAVMGLMQWRAANQKR